ncbi:MAG: protein phosphatase 2C domain-containing protein [Anaerolineae bacterium]|nr:protein phosphatase 2C domain-containing protein [Anaerolineae bacterium]
MTAVEGFSVSAGTIIGRTHAIRQTNRQDAHALAVAPGYAAGVLCDGCGEGAASEVGAMLAARYLAQEAARMLGEGGAAPADLPGALYPALVEYLGGLLDLQRLVSVDARQRFVRDYLLFTVVGFVLNRDAGVVFVAGDGLASIDGAVCRFDYDNRPPYPAYHLLAAGGASSGFETIAFDPAGLQDLGLASDGFDVELFGDLRGLVHPRAVQRKLNVWSDKERRFLDDATVIWVQRV